MAKRALRDEESESESSSESSEEEAVKLSDEELYKLQKQVENYPTSWEAHMQYIRALRSMKLWDKLKDARRAIQKRFPLPDDVWLEWINDEKRQAEDRDEKEDIVGLYELAVQDYRSVKLWSEYGQFIQILSGEDGASETSLQRVREVYEQAITQLGLDIARGPIIWEAYRDFEERLLDVMLSLGDAKHATEQIDRVRALWKRQLAVPLIDMEEEWPKYVEFEKTHKGTVHVAALEGAYKAALAEVEARKKWEKILPEDMSQLLPTWYEYIAFEESKKDPARIQTLYERVICGYCLIGDIWLKYLHYLETHLKAVSVAVLPVLNRAVRNCPWQASIWASYLRALERYKKPQAEIDEVFERGQGAGLPSAYDYYTLFEAYLDVLVRRGEAEPIRKNFAWAIGYFDQYFPDSGLSGAVQRTWAGIEVHRLKDVPAARKIFEELLKKHSLVADYWLAWLHLERQFGDVNACRSLLKRAVNTAVDQPERLFEAWLRFEREVGDLESFEHALHRVEAQQKLVHGRREKEAAQEATKLEAQQKAQAERTTAREKKGDKPKREKAGEAKRRTGEDRAENERDKPKRARSDTVPRPSAPSGSTIHVSNLAFVTKEEQLQEAFGKFGPIKAVRLVRDKQGRLKGFAFIDYETEASARAALALDRTPLSERTISVALATIGAPLTSYETNTLFVSLLPFNLDENAIRTLFQEAGGVKDVRLIRNGKLGASKGYAYVEMADEPALLAALKFHQRQVQGKPISVVRSLPPRRTAEAKPAAPAAVPEAPSAGSSDAQPSTADGKATKRLALGPMPRSLKKPAAMKAAPKFVPAAAESSEITPMQTDEKK